MHKYYYNILNIKYNYFKQYILQKTKLIKIIYMYEIVEKHTHKLINRTIKILKLIVYVLNNQIKIKQYKKGNIHSNFAAYYSA